MGVSEIEKIAAFYCKTQTHTGDDKEVYTSEPFLKCSEATLVNQWQRCKDIVKANRYPTHSIFALWGALAALEAEGNLKCPEIMKLVTLVLTHPVHSCDCERTFSAQNLTVTPLRNRLSAEKCDQMMRVKIEGGGDEGF